MRILTAALLCCLAGLVVAEEQKWGPAPGIRIDISAQDESGVQRSLADLAGERGLLLFLNRSADW